MVQVRPNGKTEKMLLVRTNVADADECCMFGKWLQITWAAKRHTHTHTHTHFQVQGLEKGVSENEAPGPVGAYTTTHNDTITLMPNLIHRISFTESHSQN